MKYVPLSKQSKRAKKEFYAQRRGSWHGINPVTRSTKSIRRYSREQSRQEARKLAEENT